MNAPNVSEVRLSVRVVNPEGTKAGLDEAEIARVGRLLRRLKGTGAGRRRMTSAQLELLARRRGLAPADAVAWAASAGAAACWPAKVLEVIGEVTGGVCELDRFVLRSELATLTAGLAASKQEATTKPSARSKRRRRNDRRKRAVTRQRRGPQPQVMPLVKVVDRPTPTQPRLHGAQSPARPLPIVVEVDHPDRPKGWSTTDWVNSKS